MTKNKVCALLASSFTLLLILIIGLGWIGRNEIGSFQHSVQTEQESHWLKLRAAQSAVQLSSLNSRITMSIFMTEDPSKRLELFAERAENTGSISALVKSLERDTETAEERHLLEAVKAARKPYVDTYLKALDLLLNKNRPVEARHLMDGPVQTALTEYHARWSKFLDYEGEGLGETIVDSDRAASRSMSLIRLMTLTAGLMAVAIAFFTMRRMRRQTTLREEAESSLLKLNASLEKRIEERTRELAVALNDAQSAVKAKGDFLACMSHEIRTPLNAVIGMTGLLLDTPLNAQQSEFAQNIHMGGEVLLSVINDVLDFSKLEAGKVELEKNDFDLVALLEECGQLFAAPAQKKGLELAVYTGLHTPTALRGDAPRLRQVLINFLSNALKFTEQGEIVLRAIQQNETADGATIRFEVRDSGIGIPLETQARLFQAFTQADASTTRRYGGTGLGLAISRRIIELMGGRIGVTNAPTRGSIFWVTVPLAKQRTPTPPLRTAAPVLPQKTLVVDDNRTNREIVLHQLRAWGVSCDEADGAKTALSALMREAAAGKPYGLVLMDMQMPDTDGLALTKQIKSTPGLGPVSVILMSSIGSLDATAAAAAGLSGWLTKPVRQSVLFNAVMSAFSKEAAPAVAAPIEPAAEPAHRSERILVVEDVEINRTVAVLQLKKLGYESDAVENGLAALRALKARAYSLILMDCHMPELDGFEASARIREMGGRFRDIPIIALTADALSGDREKCLSAGMNDYITKPTNVDKLKEALTRWLAGKPSGSGSAK